MKIVNAVIGALFLLFAYFQFNDPDATPWVIFYLALAGIAGFAAFNRFNVYVSGISMAVCLIGMIWFAPGMFEFFTNDDGIKISQGMSNDYPYIEKAREFGGLLIGLAAMAYIFFQARKAKV